MMYYIDNLIRTWRRDWIEADSDEEAIEMAETGNYIAKEVEFLDECSEFQRNEHDKWIFEIFDEHDDLVAANYEDGSNYNRRKPIEEED